MNAICSWLPAALAVGEAESRTYFELVRLQSMTEWWHWLLLLVCVAGIVAYTIYLYQRDAVELPTTTAALLCLLRVLAFAGLLFYFLQLEKRSERQLVKNSRVLLLIDTSQSMGLTDASEVTKGGKSRIDQVVAELSGGKTIQELRAKHDVVVYRFDESERPLLVASLPKFAAADDLDPTSKAGELAAALAESRWLYTLAGIMLAVGAGFGVLYLFLRDEANRPPSWAVLVASVLLVIAVGMVGVASVRNPTIGPLEVAGFAQPKPPEEKVLRAGEEDKQPAGEPADEVVDWPAKLVARGAKSRLGDAVQFLVDKERGGPIAGLILFTDGRNNTGVAPDVAGLIATEANVPLYTVGLGSEKQPVNVRIVDVEAPSRVYPEDKFTITGYVQATGLAGRYMKVRLYSGPADDAAATVDESKLTMEEERRITLGEDGALLPLKFEMKPVAAGGRRTYRLKAVPQDRSEDLDPRDNEKTATVEIVDSKSKVLLVAGGPQREYRFLHNLLYRDRDTTVDILLQTGRPGISQEAHDILFEFPQDPEKLFEYDCIVMFDPDWSQLTEADVKLLERWVAEKAGGLVLVAGPVFTPEWTTTPAGNRQFDLIKALYPVVFYGRTAIQIGRSKHSGETIAPLNFTRDGRESEFLWLADTAGESAKLWAEFPGVYGYQSTKDAKPGAKIYARFGDPNIRNESDQPIFFAGQFYGAGRVFYLASGEMWRLRALDDTHYETFYTKLLRWASQGRLNRDTTRGVLLVDKDRSLLGDTIAVRAHLVDPQHQPLQREEVTAKLIAPDGKLQDVPLRKVKDAAKEGEFSGQFTVSQEGDYRLVLPVPNADEEKPLVREVRVRVPNLEMERPQQDRPLLMRMAEQSGGAYYAGMAAINSGSGETLTTRLNAAPADQVTYLPGTPDKPFSERLMLWILVMVGGVLALEWLIRRLSKLA